jgi:carboxyl-terminal processing protease
MVYVESLYVDELNLSQIVNKAITGLLEQLDSHSGYMGIEKYSSMQTQMKGEFGGLGIVVGLKHRALTIISPIDDTPAHEAGVKAGDIILKIDEKSTIDMTLDDAVKLMRGTVGEPVIITVVRKDEATPLKIKIIRDVIKIYSVKAKKIDDNILYLRVSSFDNNVVKQVSKYILQNKKNMDGIILDLRSNPGGLLNQATGLIDLFVDDGLILSQKGRNKAKDESFYASAKNTLTKKPLIVLVDGGSASASEIVSGSLQDLSRAIIVGEKTFGKGSVQIVLPITKSGAEAIKITIAKYYLPSGRTIQALGVTPDIISYAGKGIQKSENEFAIKEKDLKKHLLNELEKITPNKTKQDTNSDKNETKKSAKANKDILTTKEISQDNQLKTALDILKAIIIIKGK